MSCVRRMRTSSSVTRSSRIEPSPTHSATEPGGTTSGPCHWPIAALALLAQVHADAGLVEHRAAPAAPATGRQPSVPSASMTRAIVLLTVACCCGVMLCLARSAPASCSAGIRILSQ